jgi:hypothetical protein
MWYGKNDNKWKDEEIQRRACKGTESDLQRIISAISNRKLKEDLEKYFDQTFSQGRY